ncbi:MAG: hypothetical protein FWG87_15175, partial [Defluviitaleaceae bacterium]|nr:hypothetical protein [Defluviitaleaceae bacterium]
TDLSVPILPRSALVGVRCCLRKPLTPYCLLNGRYLPRIIERAYLGADKSAPYKKPANPHNKRNI